jgi:BCCT family betaine/carnitine transporter
MNKANHRLDVPMFLTTIGVILGVTLPIIIFNESAGLFISSLYDTLTSNFGWIYQWYAFITLFFLLWLAFSKYGKIKLSSNNEEPDYNNLTWITMIF